MDRPHTPGSHIDWADDDDSLPDLNDWGYIEGKTAPVQPEEAPASIPPIPEEVPLQSVIPEVKIEGEPSPDETKPQHGKPGPTSDAAPRTHKVLRTRSKRGTRPGGNSRTQQLPPALNLTDSVSQGSSLSPIQSTTATTATAIPHTSKPQGPKRQNSNRGQSLRNNQGQTNPRDNGNGGGRQRGQNGVAVTSPMRNSFSAKTGPKANHTPPVRSQAPAPGPGIAHPVTNPSTESDLKPPESKGETVPDDERKKGKPVDTPPNTDTNGPNPDPTTTNHTPHELESALNNVKPNSPQSNNRNSYNPSHSRSHTYGGRTQGGPQPPHSAPNPDFPHHTSNNNPTSPNSRNPKNLRQSPGIRSSGPGPLPRSAGYERHNRNHSSPSGVGGATRQPRTTRPVLAEHVFSQLAKSLGSVPGSPKKEPPVPPPAS